MTAYESKYRTLLDKPYHRSWHDTTGAPQAKAGFCTVAGVEKPHRATRSLYVRDSKGGTCWVAACDQHVPPMADDDAGGDLAGGRSGAGAVRAHQLATPPQGRGSTRHRGAGPVRPEAGRGGVMTERLCERCGQPIAPGLLERHPHTTRCADCQSRVQQVVRGHRPKDDLREQREELPEALRRVDPLWEGD